MYVYQHGKMSNYFKKHICFVLNGLSRPVVVGFFFFLRQGYMCYSTVKKQEGKQENQTKCNLQTLENLPFACFNHN